MAGINLPQAYSTILDKGFVLKSLTAPAFKGKYKVVGGTTKTFKIYSTDAQAMRDYTSRKSPSGAGGVGTFGYEYQSVQNSEQVVTATEDRYFAGTIDKSDAKFSRDGSLDTSEFMRVQMEEEIYPMLDKFNIAALATAGAANATVLASTDSTAYKNFSTLMTAQTNALVPASGRVVFASASWYSKIKQDPKFTPDSELTATSRRNGNYGTIDKALVIEVPDAWMPDDKTDAILTHESAAAAPKHLADYNQGEFKESASGFFVNGRVVHDAFVFDKKVDAIQVLRSAAATTTTTTTTTT